MKSFVADFETTTDEKDCRVWAYAIIEVGNLENFITGNCIENFIKWCAKKHSNNIVYFHNLKFDGAFIIDYLLNNGFKWIKDKKDIEAKTFETLISEMGAFYSITVYFDKDNKKRTNKVTFYDSLKLLNFSVEKIAKDFDLPVQKLEINYKAKREKGHILTPQERAYIKCDVEIVARALEILFNYDLAKMTIGSCALDRFKKMVSMFDKYYPSLTSEEDRAIRLSYRGGFTYLNPIYQEKILGEGSVLDVNSLYPYVMHEKELPFGQPRYYEGKYEEDPLFPLFVECLSCSFKLKKGKIPTLQLKHNLNFLPNEYIESSEGDIVTLTLTSVDLELFFKQYDVHDITYHFGYKFKSIKGLFSSYIDYWTEEKIKAKKDGNGALYRISKLMLNSLYGKFGTNPEGVSKIPYLENNQVKYYFSEVEKRKAIYIPVASFITSYARYKTIMTSQAIRDYSLKEYGHDLYVYSDTDSIHLLAKAENGKFIDENLYKIVEVDDFKLGFWKLESTFKKAKFLRQKCYIEQDYENEIHTTIAGLPKRMGKYINFENFKPGFTIRADDTEKIHKLRFKHVPGGVVLVDTDFTIKNLAAK